MFESWTFAPWKLVHIVSFVVKFVAVFGGEMCLRIETKRGSIAELSAIEPAMYALARRGMNAIAICGFATSWPSAH
jgi:hypothetical protein